MIQVGFDHSLMRLVALVCLCVAEILTAACASSAGSSAPLPKDMASFDYALSDQADDGAPRDLAKKPVDFTTFDDLLPTIDLAGSCATVDVVINELRTAGTTASDEFVELYNPCGGSVDLTGYKLVYRSATGSTDSTIITLAQPIAATSYLLIASSAYAGGSVDATYASGAMAGAGGGVALKDGGGNVIDSVGYGTATNAFVEGGTAATAPAAFESIARTPNGNDTDHSNTDFAVTATPTPRAQN